MIQRLTHFLVGTISPSRGGAASDATNRSNGGMKPPSSSLSHEAMIGREPHPRDTENQEIEKEEIGIDRGHMEEVEDVAEEEEEEEEEIQRMFKVVLVGDGGVGKTTFVRRMMNSSDMPVQAQYHPTIGIEIHPIILDTTRGSFTFQVWDTAGQERFGGLRDGYYIHSDAALIMFDVSSFESYSHVAAWYRDIRRVCGRIPIILLGNKVDVPDRTVPVEDMKFHRRHHISYFDVSAFKNFNVQRTFVELCRLVVGDASIQMITEEEMRLSDAKKTLQSPQFLSSPHAKKKSTILDDVSATQDDEAEEEEDSDEDSDE